MALMDAVEKSIRIDNYNELCIEFEMMMNRYKANLDLSLEWGIVPKEPGLISLTKSGLKFCDFTEESDLELIVEKTETLNRLIEFIKQLTYEHVIVMILHYYKKHNLLHALPSFIKEKNPELPYWVNIVPSVDDFEDDGNYKTESRVRFAV